jgi:hypothetical protein
MTLRSFLLALGALALGYWIGWGHGRDVGVRDTVRANIGGPSIFRVAAEDLPPTPRMEMCDRIIGEVEAELLREELLATNP